MGAKDRACLSPWLGDIEFLIDNSNLPYLRTHSGIFSMQFFHTVSLIFLVGEIRKIKIKIVQPAGLP